MLEAVSQKGGRRVREKVRPAVPSWSNLYYLTANTLVYPNHHPVTDTTEDILFIGRDPNGGGSPFRPVEMEHTISGCGYLAEPFGSSGQQMILAKGDRGHKGFTALLKWGLAKIGENCSITADCQDGWCANGVCSDMGTTCKVNGDCSLGACGYAAYDWSSPRICCASGIKRRQTIGNKSYRVCTEQPDGAACKTGNICTSGFCVNGICG